MALLGLLTATRRWGAGSRSRRLATSRGTCRRLASGGSRTSTLLAASLLDRFDDLLERAYAMTSLALASGGAQAAGAGVAATGLHAAGAQQAGAASQAQRCLRMCADAVDVNPTQITNATTRANNFFMSVLLKERG